MGPAVETFRLKSKLENRGQSERRPQRRIGRGYL